MSGLQHPESIMPDLVAVLFIVGAFALIGAAVGALARV
jgi:cell division protein FtsX